MSESSLSITYTQLQFAVAHYLGLGAVGSWSAEDTAVIDMVIASGLRQFYFPAPVMEDGRLSQMPYQWTFLTPVAEIETIAPYSTGTIAIDNGATTVILTTGVWPDWTVIHGSLVVDTTVYEIATRTDDTHLELSEAWTEDTVTASEYILRHDGNYDLPDDFGGIKSDLVISRTSAAFYPNIILVGEGRIREARQVFPSNVSGSTTAPMYAAVRPKVQSDTTVGQRFEIMFHPLPQAAFTITYVKRVLPEMLVTTDIEYPYGGAEHAETIRAACIAAAEEQENGNRLNGNPVYDKKKLFEQRLAASIALDKQMNGTMFFGYNSDRSNSRHRAYNGDSFRRSRECRDSTLTKYLGSGT